MNNDNTGLLLIVYFVLVWLCGFMASRAFYLRRIRALKERIDLLRFFPPSPRPPAIKQQPKIFWGRN